VGSEMCIRDSNASDVAAGVQKVANEFGGIDTLVNSAGVCRYRPFEEIREEEWDLVVGINLKGTFLVCQAAMPHLRQSGRGRIVNVASVAGRRGAALLAPYVSSKFGVIGLTQTLALEFAHAGVTVNAVVPANTPGTGMGRELLRQKLEMGWAKSEEEIIARTAASSFPLGRVGKVEDTANAIVFLVSEAAGFITGHSLVVDGGNSLIWPSISQAPG